MWRQKLAVRRWFRPNAASVVVDNGAADRQPMPMRILLGAVEASNRRAPLGAMPGRTTTLICAPHGRRSRFRWPVQVRCSVQRQQRLARRADGHRWHASQQVDAHLQRPRSPHPAAGPAPGLEPRHVVAIRCSRRTRITVSPHRRQSSTVCWDRCGAPARDTPDHAGGARARLRCGRPWRAPRPVRVRAVHPAQAASPLWNNRRQRLIDFVRDRRRHSPSIVTRGRVRQQQRASGAAPPPRQQRVVVTLCPRSAERR